MKSPLTKRQKEILDYIESFIKKNVFSPSLEEIRGAFKLKAISTVHEHLENLKKKGYISKDMNQARGIQLKEEKSKLVEVKVSLELNKKDLKAYKEDLKVYYYNPQELVENTIQALLIVEDANGLNKNDVVIFLKTNKAKKGEMIIDNYNNKYEVGEFKNSKNSSVFGKVLQIQRTFN